MGSSSDDLTNHKRKRRVNSDFRLRSFWPSLAAMSFRQPDILEIARSEGKVTVEGLATRFGVTVQTIRRDLTELAEAGKLERVHGGAVLPSGTANIAYEARRALQAEAKARIAAAIAAEVPNDAALFLNIGTTTEAVAQALLGHQNLMVVTNNLNVAATLQANPTCEIVVMGGTFRRADGGLVGPLASQSAERFKVDIAVIGCSALDAEGDLLDFDLAEVAVSQTIISRARRTFLAADHTKFSRSAPARIASVAELDTVFTDVPVPAQFAEACAGVGTRIVTAAPPCA